MADDIEKERKVPSAAHKLQIMSTLLRYPIRFNDPEIILQNILDDIAREFAPASAFLWSLNSTGYQIEGVSEGARLTLDGDASALLDEISIEKNARCLNLTAFTQWAEMESEWKTLGHNAMVAHHIDGDSRDLLLCMGRGEDTFTTGSLALFCSMADAAFCAQLRRSDLSRQKRFTQSFSQARRFDALGGLVSSIAHEINTPIQFISSNLEFLDGNIKKILPLLDKSEFEEVRAPSFRVELEAALQDSLEGIGQIHSILSSVRGVNHKDAAASEPIDINLILNSAVRLCRPEIDPVADLLMDFEPDLPKLNAIPSELNRAFINLLINAAYAVRENHINIEDEQKGFIALRSRFDLSGQIIIEVEDSGCGIPEEHLERIYDHYFTTKPEGKGTGQGLAIVYDIIVCKNGGKLDVMSRVGEGTVFTLSLPVNQLDDKQLLV